MSGKVTGAAGCLLVAVIIAICLVAAYFWTLLAIACSGCWVFGMDFSVAWDLAFHRSIWVVAGWGFLFLGGLSASVKAS